MDFAGKALARMERGERTQLGTGALGVALGVALRTAHPVRRVGSLPNQSKLLATPTEGREHAKDFGVGNWKLEMKLGPPGFEPGTKGL